MTDLIEIESRYKENHFSVDFSQDRRMTDDLLQRFGAETIAKVTLCCFH